MEVLYTQTSDIKSDRQKGKHIHIKTDRQAREPTNGQGITDRLTD